MNKNCKKQTKQSLELKSLEKGGELCIKWKSYYTSLKSWIDKKKMSFYKISQYFCKLYKGPSGNEKQVYLIQCFCKLYKGPSGNEKWVYLIIF